MKYYHKNKKMKCIACDRFLTDLESTNYNEKMKDYMDLCSICLHSIYGENSPSHPVKEYLEEYEQEEMASSEE